MVYSITTFASLSLFLAFAYFFYRLFYYWKKDKNVVAKFWLWAVGAFLIFSFFGVVRSLFFGNNPVESIMYLKVVGFIQPFSLASFAYIISYSKFPRISPWIGFVTVFILGLIGATATLFVDFNPRLLPNGVMDWGPPSSGIAIFVASFLRGFLFLITCLPLAIINFQEFKRAESPAAKQKALGLSLTLFLFLIVAFIDFFVSQILKIDLIWRDIFYFLGSITLFLTLFITQRTTSRKSL